MWLRGPQLIDPDLAPCGVVLFGDDGRLMAVNDTLIRMLDLDKSTLHERCVDDLLAPAAKVFHQMVLAPMLRLNGRADEVHLILRKRNGDDIHVLTCGVRRLEDSGPVNHCAFMPIDQRKKLESELVQTRRAAEEAPGALFQLEIGEGGQGRFLYASDAIETLIGVSPSALRQDAQPFFDALHPEDRARFHSDVEKAGLEGRGGHYRFRVVQNNPPRTIWCETRSTPRRLPDGKVLWNGYIADITRQKNLEETLHENEKLKLTSVLASGIAHDFNNVLGSIQGLAELCLMEAAPSSRQARNLQRILDSGERAAGLVRQMLAYARQAPHQVHAIPMADFVGGLKPLLEASLPQGVTLATHIDAAGTFEGDEMQLELLLLNLVTNAGYAMRERPGRVRVSIDQPAGKTVGRKPPRAAMRLQVSDEGCGIAPADLPNIYQPFFTTKPVGDGAGLGLSAVHGIVMAHHGEIEVSSALGEGTTFTVWLPLSQP